MGKRFKKLFIYTAAMIFLVASAGLLIADQSKVVLVGGGQAYKPLDDFALKAEVPGMAAGDNWYVDSGKSASGDGKSWDYAVITLDEAIDLCTASSGDVIHVAPGHAEDIDAATDVVADVIGLTVIGYGEGGQRPTFSWADAAAATIAVSAADFKLYNMIFDGSSTSSDGPNAMFTITGAGFQLIGCRIVTGDSTEAATLVITGDADADRMKVIGCEFTGSTDTGTTAAISFSAAATDIEIAYCTFKGDYSSAAIYSASAILEVNIHHNYIYNFQDDDHAIEISSNTSTGVIAYNHVVTDAYATAIDSGGLDVIETYWSNDEVDDVMAVQVWTNEDGAVTWSATQLVVLEAQANEALVDEDLDHLLIASAGTAAYPTNVLDDSVIGHIMATDLITSYVRTTDSLEAIGTDTDAILVLWADGTTIEAEVQDALQDMELDHLADIAVDTDLDTTVHDDSFIGYIMAITDVSTYSRASDSLEALGTDADAILVLVANAQQQVNNTASIDADNLDHLASTAIPGNLEDTTAVDDAAILGYILAITNVSDYDRTTDSLEAIGADVVAIEIDTTAIEADTQDLQNMAERCATRTSDTLPITATETIFTVAGGPVQVLELVGEVTTVIGATATNLKISADPTTGAATDICAVLDVSNDLDGSFYSLATGVGSVLVNTDAGVVNGQDFTFIVPIGDITINTAATATGEIAWFIRYKPLAPGATVTATTP